MPKRGKSPHSAPTKAAKKAKAENPVQKHLNTIVKAVESEMDYQFPCREFLAQVIPIVLGKPVEQRHEFESRSSKMITEAVHEALTLLKEQEKELQYKVNNTEEVKTNTEAKLKSSCDDIKATEEKITTVEATVKEANQKLTQDEKVFEDESANAKEHEDRYQAYQDDFQLLTTTLEDLIVVIATPPTAKKEQTKHQAGLDKVLKKFFASETTICSILPRVLYMGADAHSEFDKVTLAAAQKLFTDKLSSLTTKIEEDKPDTKAKDAAKDEAQKSTEHRDRVTNELRELRRSLRDLVKMKKELEGQLKNHPKNVQKWENEHKRMASTIETYDNTVVAAHDFLINRSEVVEVPVEEAAPAVAEDPVVPEKPVVEEDPVVEKESPKMRRHEGEPHPNAQHPEMFSPGFGKAQYDERW